MIDGEEREPRRLPAGRMTMLQLVQSLTGDGLSECDIVSLVFHLVERGQVTLIGNFRDTALEMPSDERRKPEASTSR